MVGNRLKSIKNPLPTSLVGKRYDAAAYTPIADQNALTTGPRQLTTFKKRFYDR